jgi:uncharacterized coiled-coil DUF342 family protein
MEKKEAQDLTKAIVSLVNVIKEQNKINDAYNKALRDNTDTLKDLRTRLASVANAISNGSVVNQ